MANFIGTDAIDVFGGTAAADTAVGNGGNDQLFGAGDNDTLAGGSGADQVAGGDGDDFIFGAEISPAFTTPYGGPLFTLPLLDTGTDVDQLAGGSGDDMLFAGFGDRVDGGAGTDTLLVSFAGATAGVVADFRLAAQTIGGGQITGVETIGWIEGSNFADTIRDADTNGNSAPIFGLGGDDQLFAGQFTGSLIGGDGNDTLDASAALAASLLVGGTGDDVLIGGIGAEQLSGGSGADTIEGNDGNDTLASGDADLGNPAAPFDDLGTTQDVLSGGAGDDLMAIGFGDSADGGSGLDRLRLALGGATSGVALHTADILAGTPFVLGGGTIQGVEALVDLKGSNFFDNFVVAAQATTLTIDGGDGNDTVTSASAVDFTGGAGNDRFIGSNAADRFDGGDGLDTVDYRNVTAGFSLDLAAGPAGPGGDQLFNVENIDASGFADTLAGTEGVNLLNGRAGNDSLSGRGGDDTIEGGTGDDRIDGGAGIDTASYASATGIVRVSLATATAQNTGLSGRDQLVDIENLLGSTFNDQLVGNDTANRLSGALGNDALKGGGGDDTLVGGAGIDQLTGGAGADRFVFDRTAGTGNNDAIKDFTSGEDIIALSQTIFTALDGNGLGGVDASNFTTGTKATAADHHLVYNTTSGQLFYDVDGVGGAVQSLVAIITGAPVLVIGDFVIAG